MTVQKLLAKKRISRALFKVCRLNGFDSLADIENYFSEHQSFDALQWCAPSEKEELLTLIEADLKRLSAQWQIPSEILEATSIVRTAEFILSQENLLPLHQLSIFKESLRVYQGQTPLIPSAMAAKLGISERYVRGRRKLAFTAIIRKLEALQPIADQLLQNYNIDPQAEFISIDEASASFINARAGTSFTPQLLALIFGCYLKKTHTLLGNPEEVLAGNFVGIRHYWNNFYLLRNDLAEAMDFESFFKEVDLLQSTWTPDRPALQFRSFLSYFIRNKEKVSLETLIPPSQELLFRELGVQLDQKGCIAFRAATEPQAPQYPFKALEQLGSPSNPETIRATMNALFPQVYIDARVLKSVMKSKYGFTNHRQVYGLKKWKHQKPGTGIIEDPQVLEDIEDKYPVNSNEYWQEHWETTLDRLLDFCGQNGLPKKESTGNEKKLFYWITLQEQRIREGKLATDRIKAYKDFRRRFPAKTSDYWDAHWAKKFAELQAFGKEHNRLPWKCGPRTENLLYNWLNNQRYAILNDRLEEEKQRQLRLFTNIYEKKSRTKLEQQWEEHFTEVSNFVDAHSRLPKQMGEEYRLGRWFRCQLRKRMQGKLTPNQKWQMERLMKLQAPTPSFVIKERWEKNWAALQAFAKENERLPKKYSENTEEQALYSWLTVQYTRANKGKLTRQQKSRILKLKAEYPFVKTVHYKLDWDERYNEVKAFCWKNRRLPGRNNSPQEATLNHWWRNQFRRLKKGTLELRQKRLLKDLKDLYAAKARAQRLKG